MGAEHLKLTQWASFPLCTKVIIILSVKFTIVATVSMPLIVVEIEFVFAGYGLFVTVYPSRVPDVAMIPAYLGRHPVERCPRNSKYCRNVGVEEQLLHVQDVRGSGPRQPISVLVASSFLDPHQNF